MARMTYRIAYSLHNGPWQLSPPLPDMGAVCARLGELASLGLVGWYISGGGCG